MAEVTRLGRCRSEIEKRLRWHWRRPRSRSWRVDETYVKVRGKWSYLYRAVDKLGNTIDFYLSSFLTQLPRFWVMRLLGIAEMLGLRRHRSHCGAK